MCHQEPFSFVFLILHNLEGKKLVIQGAESRNEGNYAGMENERHDSGNRLGNAGFNTSGPVPPTASIRREKEITNHWSTFIGQKQKRVKNLLRCDFATLNSANVINFSNHLSICHNLHCIPLHNKRICDVFCLYQMNLLFSSAVH